MYYAMAVSTNVKENEINPWGHIFTTPHFLHNSQMGPISSCVALLQTGKAWQGQTPLLIELIHKLKEYVMKLF